MKVKDINDAAEAASRYVLQHINWRQTLLRTLHWLGSLLGGGGATGVSATYTTPSSLTALLKILGAMFVTTQQH